MTGNVPEAGIRKECLRVLTFTTLYPNAVKPHHGIFVEQRLRKLLASQDVAARVIAPVPWFPATSRAFRAYADFALVPDEEVRHGIPVQHPRYPAIPKMGMSSAPLLLATASHGLMKRCSREAAGFDLIDSHYFYPDGVAAALLGRWLSKPVVITARGTDVNLIPRYRIPRKWILWAAKSCARIITVSDALRQRLIEIGVNPQKIRTLRNGVDLALFQPLPGRESLRRKLRMTGPTILSIGHLIERKGHHLLIEALSMLPDVTLVVIGDGPMKAELASLTRKFNVERRVSFAGALAHEGLVEYYCAADALVLASSREGMANVLLESIACGTPVVATPYWGNPEVVSDRRAGVLTEDRTPAGIAKATRELLDHLPERTAVREYAESFSWDATSIGQMSIFRAALRTGDHDGGTAELA